MKPQIQQEKAKKLNNRIYIVMGSIGVIIGSFWYMHYAQIEVTRRMTLADKINIATNDLLAHPFSVKVNSSTIGSLFLLLIGIACLAAMLIIEGKLKKHDNPDTVKGEARLMNYNDYKQYNLKRVDPVGLPATNGKRNMILSKDLLLALDGSKTRRNCNMLIIGASGAGKSRFFAAPNILQFNSNFVITDPSGELLNDYGKSLEDNGYNVRVLNLVDVYQGNRYNPFHYIKEEKDVFVLVNTLIKNTTPEGKGGGDPFWEKSENLLLSALILYLWHTAPEEKQTFSEVLRLLDKAEIDENDDSAESPLDRLFNDLRARDPKNLAVRQYDKFKIGAGKTLKSILISVAVRLQTFDLADIQYLTDKDEMDFDTFADKKQVLFVIIPTADLTFNFIVSLLYSQLFTSLYTYVETRAQFGWQVIGNDGSIIKVFQAQNRNDSSNAKKKAEKLVKEINTGKFIVEPNNKRKIYNIYTRKKELLTWYGSKKQVEAFKESCKGAKAVPCPRKCPQHVRFILDEFANIGQIPDFAQKLATIRKYEISCSIIIQAISQLKEIYEKQWNTIAGNCDTKLDLGCDDIETLEYLTKTVGKKTTIVANESYQEKGKGSTSLNRDGMEIITVDQLAMMDESECFIKVRGEHPYYGKKYELTEHPNYNHAQKTAGTFIIHTSATQKIDNRAFRLRSKETTIKSVNVLGTTEEMRHEKPKTNKNDNAVKNAAQKKSANIAKQHFEDEDDTVMLNDALNSLASSLGLTPNSTEEEILESCQSVLDLQYFPNDDEYKYTETE